MVNNKHVFWQAFVLTVLVFLIGLIFGFFFEIYTADKISSALTNSEINLLDEQVRVEATSHFDIDCEVSKKGLFDFADRIYWEARNLEDEAISSQFNKDFGILHKRYDLLRAMLWLESTKLRESCNDDFHTVVYLYEFDTNDFNQKAKQISFSKLLLSIKDAYPKSVLLIPIAVNTNLSSVKTISDSYNVSSFPVVILDNKKIINELIDFQDLENIIFDSNK